MNITFTISKKNLDLLQQAYDILADLESIAYSLDLDNTGELSGEIKSSLYILLQMCENKEFD